MKTRILCAAIAVSLCLAWFPLPVAAQSPSSPSMGTRVAVIDISYIFRNHPGFKQSMEAMKQEVKQFENQLRQRGAQIQKLQEQMQSYNPSSQEYKQIEDQILRIQADGQAIAMKKKKDFLLREARIYYDTYNEIVNDVARFSEQHSISLVVRFNSEKVNPDERASVLEGVNRAVVYQKNLNITFAILERLQRLQQANSGKRPGAPTKK